MLHPYEMPVHYVSRETWQSRLAWMTSTPDRWMGVEPYAHEYPTYMGVENCSGEMAVILPEHEAICLASVENPDGYMLRPRDTQGYPVYVTWHAEYDALAEQEAEDWVYLDDWCWGYASLVDAEMTQDEADTLAEYKAEVQPNYMTW